jgi:uncharacterized protein YcbK (DUF882 family)
MLTKEQKTNLPVTKNFNISELEFRNTVPESMIADACILLKNLQVLRDHLNAPITIISGYRSPDYNKTISGASQSQHIYARAADIQVKGKTPEQVREAILHLIKEKKMVDGGIGIYDTFVHFDVRTIAGLPKARWDERTNKM